MSDWVHCNKCSLKYNKQAKFFLGECGHIFCLRCVEKIKLTKRCSICNKNCNLMPLNKEMDQTVLDFFLPLENLLKKSVEVYKFQLQHRNQLYQNLFNKYEYAKKEYCQVTNSNRRLMKDNQILRSMLHSSDRNPRYTTSTPMSLNSESNFTFQNMSPTSTIPPQGPASNVLKMYPGYPKRMGSIFASGSSKDPSPAHQVPLGFMKPPPRVHRGSIGSNSTPKW